jgi:hypothetical protein
MAAALALVAAAWALAGVALGIGDLLAHLSPALLILVPLLGGRYPGDTALARATSRARRLQPRAARAVPRRCRAVPRLMPRGGRLLPAGLAGRAPPALPA